MENQWSIEMEEDEGEINKYIYIIIIIIEDDEGVVLRLVGKW